RCVPGSSTGWCTRRCREPVAGALVVARRRRGKARSDRPEINPRGGYLTGRRSIGMNGRVPAPRRPEAEITGVLAVVAHPDDESFALGAVLDRLGGLGARTAVLCFTAGEASTLHAVPGRLPAIRERELRDAATVLGLDRVELLHYPDGGLSEVPLDELAGHVRPLVVAQRPSHLLVFDT